MEEISMHSNVSYISDIKNNNAPTTYREVKIGRTIYCVTSVFAGEKELGPTLEKLAARHVLDEIDGRANELLRGA
jgi:hypothetical protein